VVAELARAQRHRHHRARRARTGAAPARRDLRSADIRAPEVDAIVARHKPQVVVHLASIVTPGKKSNREFEYSVDVDGTRNLLEACLSHHVKRVIVSSSGAAYGYHADNPEWLSESDPVRGNQSFAYSWHKRLVEEMLADYRAGSRNWSRSSSASAPSSAPRCTTRSPTCSRSRA
jgi:nucleoside-diphosphate-sugar epimerase